MLTLSSAGLTSTDSTDRLSRLAALAVCIVAGLIGIWLLVHLAWLLVPRGVDAEASAPAVSATATPGVATSIAQWHLFGNPQNIDLAARAANAPKTTLNLILHGIFAEPDPQLGIAIIAEGKGADHSYNVGDVVGGAKLAGVYVDHVVLNHDGVDESLALPNPETSAVPVAAASSRSAGSAANLSSTDTSPSATVPGAPTSTSAMPGGSAVLARTSAGELARQVQIEPVFDGGHISGARLSGSGAAAALMDQVGLRSTDVVTAINGTPLSSVSDPQQLIEKLGNASSLQVTVQRDGHPATLTLNLR